MLEIFSEITAMWTGHKGTHFQNRQSEFKPIRFCAGSIKILLYQTRENHDNLLLRPARFLILPFNLFYFMGESSLTLFRPPDKRIINARHTLTQSSPFPKSIHLHPLHTHLPTWKFSSHVGRHNLWEEIFQSFRH